MAGFLDRRRAATYMENEGLAALVLCQPESIVYASGAFPGVASFWRRAGAACLVIPADENMPVTAIVGDLQAASFAAQSGISDVRSHRIWVETDRYPFAQGAKPLRSPRPAQYDLGAVTALLEDVFRERGLVRQRVGLEMNFVPVADFETFRQLPVTWADCSRIVERLRAIKSAAEIDKLRRAAEYARAGLGHLLSAVEPGMDAARLTEIWRTGAIAEATRRGDPPPQSSWAYIAVGGDGFAPGGPAKPGDIIKVDVGCVIDGYSSDGARTAVLSEPRPMACKVFDALHRAFDVGLSMVGPGVRLDAIYKATATTMWNQGFESYGRGHFGHGVGSSIWSEEWPFISAHSDAVLEPGMVIAYETPWYIDGLGGFIIEDQLLITETGAEVMAPFSRELAMVKR